MAKIRVARWKFTGFNPLYWVDWPESVEILKRYGIELVPPEAECELRLVGDLSYDAVGPQDLPESKEPLVLVDCTDCIPMWNGIRRMVAEDRVRAILRPFVYRDLAAYDAPRCAVDACFNYYADQHQLPLMTPPPTRVEKIHLALPLLVWDWRYPNAWVAQYDKIPRLKLADRPIDVLFLGQVKYEGGPMVEEHRRACWEAIQSLPPHRVKFLHETDYRYNYLEGPCYMRLLSMTKIALAPWGWAPWGNREHEAVCAGTVLIKPRCEPIRTLPDAPAHTLTCQRDFSDLSMCVEEVLGDLNGHTTRLLKAAYRVQAEAKLPTLVTGLAHLLREIA